VNTDYQDNEKVVPLQSYREYLKDQIISLKVERELLYDALEEANRIISGLPVTGDTGPSQKYVMALENLEAFRENFVLRSKYDLEL
jgi:hypothetical protein